MEVALSSWRAPSELPSIQAFYQNLGSYLFALHINHRLFDFPDISRTLHGWNFRKLGWIVWIVTPGWLFHVKICEAGR